MSTRDRRALVDVRWSEKTGQKFKMIKLLSYETTTSQVQCCL